MAAGIGLDGAGLGAALSARASGRPGVSGVGRGSSLYSSPPADPLPRARAGPRLRRPQTDGLGSALDRLRARDAARDAVAVSAPAWPLAHAARSTGGGQAL